MTQPHKTKPQKKTVTLKIPGSTCNLGPGLDTLGLALNLYSRLTFELLVEEDLTRPFVTLKGKIKDESHAEDQGNLIYGICNKLWNENHDALKLVRITVESDIPLGCGLGGSSTAILGSLWASSVLQDRIPTSSTILADAQELEGHPETLAASLLGNLVVCAPSRDGSRVAAQELDWPESWRVLVVVPHRRLATVRSRELLPEKVDLADALYNVKKTGLFVAAVANRSEIALKDALQDALHERYRMELVPELAEVREVLEPEPVIGCVLSGGGTSVVVLVNERKKDRVLEKLRKWARVKENAPEILDLKVDKDGLRDV